MRATTAPSAPWYAIPADDKPFARITYLRALSIAQPGRAEKSLAELRQITSALVGGSPADAEKACLDHVRQAAISTNRALETHVNSSAA